MSKCNETKLIEQSTESIKSGCAVVEITGKEKQQKEIIHEIKAKTNYPIIILSTLESVELAIEAMKEGVHDFIVINNADSRFFDAVNSDLNKSIDDLNSLKQREGKIRIYNSLTKREKEVISLVAQGLTNKAIGERLGISMKTVQQHRGIACQKLLIKSPIKIEEFLRSLK